MPRVVKLTETEGGRWLPGVGGRRNGEFLFNGKMKGSGDGWWCWLYNNVNVLHAEELSLKRVDFMLGMFYHNNTFSTRKTF